MARAMLRGLLAAFALAALLSAPAGAQVNAGTDSGVQLGVPEPARGFTVAILADRTTGYDEGLAVLQQAVAELNLLDPDLVFHIGDLVPGYIRDMEQWERDIERVKAVLEPLQAPFYPLPGNHDVITGTGNPDDRRGEELYKRHFGPLYYSVDYGHAHFICLDTEESLESEPRLTKGQLEWLADDLARTQAVHIFVLMHKPLWEYPDAGWDAVHAMLRRRPVRAVFGGHFHHYYKAQERDGIQCYVVGVTGGRTFSPELAGGLEHYCLLRVEPGGYRLALVRPGHVLADDYIAGADFKAMESLRLLSRDETGVANAVRSPELGPVDEQVGVFVANPLDVPLPVTVRAAAHGGPWRFQPEAASLVVAPGDRQRAFLGLRCPPLNARDLVVPELEVEYEYVDSKGRSVPIALPRRVPLRRRVAVPYGAPAIAVDGRADEAEWRTAPVLTTATWEASPYDTGQEGPVMRIAASRAGLYFLAEARDAYVSDFRGEQMLSDALFVGALLHPEEHVGDLSRPPVAVIFPFSAGGPAEAVRAVWDARRPVGTPAEGVHLAAERDAGGRGWRCEGFVPWDVLLAGGGPPQGDVLFNIGAWDNDGDLFTELHSWAPTASAALWGELSLTATAQP